MRVSSTSFSTNFLSQINQLQQQQNKLQQEAATGQKISLPGDNPQVMTDVLNLQVQSSENTQYQNNITQLQTAATTSYTAMSSLKTIIDRVNEIATLATSGTTSPAQLTSYAGEVNNLIQEAVQLGNTQDQNGNYIFGGTQNSNPAFAQTTDANGVVTNVQYQGNASVASSEIAPNVTISAQVPGVNDSGSGARGLFTDSRSGADIFGHMLSLQQNLASGNTAAITATDVPDLAKDENNIITQISASGVLQSTLTNANSIAAAQNTNFTATMSNDTNADLATVITELTQTQTAYQAALESGSKILSMSLLNYLQ